MGLRAKFNIAFLAAFIIGFVMAAFALDQVYTQHAREEVEINARFVLGAANAIRRYTAQDLARLLPMERDGKFVAETVPAYAAQRNFHELHSFFSGYSYREPTLNPTNLADRAQEWEADIINLLRNEPSRQELIVQRATTNGPVLHVARPIVVRDEACLVCHGSPSAAPAVLTRNYGTVNGFGWKHNETIGAQMVSVPMAIAYKEARDSLMTFLGIQAVIFVVILLVLNGLLHFLVLRPVGKLSTVADKASLGEADVETYIKPGSDEISSLSRSFERMRLSLNHAMQMIG